MISAHDELAAARLTRTTRRHFLRETAAGVGGLMLAGNALASGGGAHPVGTAKRVIFLHMVGAPSQLDLFDYKPDLVKYDGQECPAELLENARFAFIRGVPKLLGPQFAFKQRGDCGAWVSDRFPNFAECVDDVAFIKTAQTDQFNHGPAQLAVHTGDPRFGKPSIGAWTTWGIGTENADLPGYIVLLSGGRPPRAGKTLWSSGFLPSVYQGVQCRGEGEPVLNVRNPKGVTRDVRRATLDALGELNRRTYEEFGDPETLTRIEQYETAFRMQTAVPEVMDISGETRETYDLYGATPGKASFANNCLLARRLVEKGVRYVQLFDWGWDAHGAAKNEALNGGFQDKCKQTDRPTAALLKDLKRRGLLDETLVVWCAEFGRTPMQENRGGTTGSLVGRDHNPGAFTVWLAGGGVKPGVTYGKTDPVGYRPAENPVPLRDLHATILRTLGFDHRSLSVPFQGLNQKLTGVKPAKVVEDVLA